MHGLVKQAVRIDVRNPLLVVVFFFRFVFSQKTLVEGKSA